MKTLVEQHSPIPSDYTGTIWGLSGIKKALILEHGPTGTTFYNNIFFRGMDYQKIRGTVFTTGLNEDDVVMGREDKLIKAVKELDEKYKPELISLVATAITSVIGLDLEGIKDVLEGQVNAKILSFSGGGLRGDYSVGLQEVFRVLANEMVEESLPSSQPAVNIIGPSTDSFNYASDYGEIKRLLEKMKVSVNTVFTRDTEVQKIKNLPSASLNIVTRDIGIEAAELLEQKFNIPFHYGLPFGVKGSISWLQDVAAKLNKKIDKNFILEELKDYGYTLAELSFWFQRYEHLKVAISCSYDYALSLVRFITEEWDISVPVVRLPVKPLKENVEEEFKKLGVLKVLVEPTVREWQEAVMTYEPHILFGSCDDFKLSPQVPVKIYSSYPAYDYLSIYDGTPFVGFRGNMYLTQHLLNLLSKHREVLR